MSPGLKQKRDLNNFQGCSLQRPGLPCCVQDPRPAKSTLLYRVSAKGRLPILRTVLDRSQHPEATASQALQRGEHYRLWFFGGLLGATPDGREEALTQATPEGEVRPSQTLGWMAQPAQDRPIHRSEPRRVLSSGGPPPVKPAASPSRAQTVAPTSVVSPPRPSITPHGKCLFFQRSPSYTQHSFLALKYPSSQAVRSTGS